MDLHDPLAQGLFELTSGRLPEHGHEVVVNADLAARGPGVGDDLELADGDRRARGRPGRVDLATADYPIAAGPLGAFGLDRPDGSTARGRAGWSTPADRSPGTTCGP